MPKPSIGVAMCTYNGEKFVAEQIESILAQTLPPVLIHVFDDGSADRTLEILQEFAEKHPQIKVFRNEERLGYNKNFEQAIASLETDYIAVSDQDDIWRADKLEIMLNKLQAAKSEKVIYCNSIRFTDKVPENPSSPPSYRRFSGNNPRKLFLYNTVSGHALLFEKSFKEKIIPFEPDIYYDWRAAVIAACNGGLAYCDEILVYQRIHDDNASFDRKKVSFREGIARQRKNVTDNFRKNQNIKELSDEDRQLMKVMLSNFENRGLRNDLHNFFLILKHRKDFFWYKNKPILFPSHFKYAFFWAFC
jgi:glycosyltransferase involved in cell wall biosynthesis